MSKKINAVNKICMSINNDLVYMTSEEESDVRTYLINRVWDYVEKEDEECGDIEFYEAENIASLLDVTAEDVFDIFVKSGYAYLENLSE